jgi:hypothetical protein
MPIQAGTFKQLPPKEKLQDLIEEQRTHNADITSYLWYIMPVAERFGDEVYAVAAQALRGSGLEVSGTELKELAVALKTPEGQERHAEQRRRHMRHVTG